MIHDYKMASGSDDGTVIIWNWLNGQLVHTLTGHSMTVSCGFVWWSNVGECLLGFYSQILEYIEWNVNANAKDRY